MRAKLYRNYGWLALGAILAGGVGVTAQTSAQRNATSPARMQAPASDSRGDYSCLRMKNGMMDMSKMMDCCKKMGMSKEQPKSIDKSMEKKPGSDQ